MEKLKKIFRHYIETQVNLSMFSQKTESEAWPCSACDVCHRIHQHCLILWIKFVAMDQFCLKKVRPHTTVKFMKEKYLGSLFRELLTGCDTSPNWADVCTLHLLAVLSFPPPLIPPPPVSVCLPMSYPGRCSTPELQPQPCLFWGNLRVLLSCPGWPRTCDPPASASEWLYRCVPYTW